MHAKSATKKPYKTVKWLNTEKNSGKLNEIDIKDSIPFSPLPYDRSMLFFEGSCLPNAQERIKTVLNQIHTLAAKRQDFGKVADIAIMQN
jgi:hypothetical protein